MPTQYSGRPGNVSLPAALAIASSTDTTPIQVNTATPHGRATGDQVYVYDHQVNYHANQFTTITVTGASSFTLDGSTATGAGAGGPTGTVQPLSFDAESYPIPSDGDKRKAASVNPALSALGDRSAAVAKLIGGVGGIVYGLIGGPWRVRRYAEFSLDDLTLATTASIAILNTTYQVLQHSAVDYKLGTIKGLCPGDYINLRFDGTMYGESSNGYPIVTLGTKQYQPGGTPPAATAQAGGTPKVAPFPVTGFGGGGQMGQSISLSAQVPWGFGNFGGNMDVVLMGKETAGTSGDILLIGGWRLEAYVVR